MFRFLRSCSGFALVLALWSQAFGLTVSQPTAGMVIKPGDDYATQILGDPWDMSNVADIDLDNSSGVSSQGFSGGIFSATASGSGTTVYPLFMGVGGSIDQSRGFLHPVDTSHYRYLTLKLKVSQASVLGLFYYLQGDSGSYASGTCGATTFFPIPATNYGIVTIDLATQNQFTQVCPQPWNSSPTVSGIRFDTTASTGTSLSIDWLRLTPAATAGDKTTVQWSDTTSTTYTIAAIDAAGTSLTLATGISGTSYQADLTILPPGAYTIKVTRTDASATASSGSFRIDSPPQIVVTSPDVHGDVSQDFATTVLGNPWGPFSATDFRLIANFKNVVYNSPAGSFDFYGRPTTGDPQWYMNLGTQMIDASYYRSFCFTMKDYGVLSVGGGSVARVFWGTSTEYTRDFAGHRAVLRRSERVLPARSCDDSNRADIHRHRLGRNGIGTAPRSDRIRCLSGLHDDA